MIILTPNLAFHCIFFTWFIQCTWDILILTFPQTMWIYSNLIHSQSFKKHYPMTLFSIVPLSDESKDFNFMALDSDRCLSFSNTIFPNDMVSNNFKLSTKYISFPLSTTCWCSMWFFHQSPNTCRTKRIFIPLKVAPLYQDLNLVAFIC